MDEIFDVIIIGAGAAGLTAGIYASRAKLSTLILNEGAVGGQMVLTEEIANYPGVESIKGYMLANIMKLQAKSFGCKIKSNIKVAKYSFEKEIKEIESLTEKARKALIPADEGELENLGEAQAIREAEALAKKKASEQEWTDFLKKQIDDRIAANQKEYHRACRALGRSLAKSRRPRRSPRPRFFR